MEREFLQLAVWDQLTAREAETVATTLGRCLPAPWKFAGVEHHTCGDQKRQVAFFLRGDLRFALIPGGEITLGYDQSRPLGPELEERRRWLDECPELPEEPETEEELAEAFEYNSWADFFGWKSNLPRSRAVRLEPFLIEVEPRRCGDLAPGAKFHREIRDRIAAQGLRLPTSDEWEYACAAGSRSLWRWGDWMPDSSPEDDWPEVIDHQPNAFGLIFHGDELVAEPGIYRHGDGGVAMCGGHGWPCAWLAFASATFRDFGDKGILSLDYHGVRGAFSLPPGCLD